MTSASDDARIKGNNIYKSLDFSNMCNAVVIGRLEDAAKEYTRANQLAQSHDDTCKACKNLALVHSKLASIKADDNPELIVYHYEMSFRSGKEALEHGQRAEMSLDWITHLKTAEFETVKQFTDDFLIESVSTIRDREKYCARISRLRLSRESVAYLRHAEAQILFNHAVKLREKEDHIGAKNYLEKTYTPMTLCQEQNARSEVIDENDLFEFGYSIQQEKNLCESRIMLNQAKTIIHDATFEQEFYNLDLLWHAADMMRYALLQTTCLETECMIRAEMSALYRRQLTLTQKAKGHARYVVKEVAESFAPRNVTTTDWYKLALSVLKEIQDEVRRLEELDWNQKRAPYILELKVELDALKATEDSIEPLLLHVYDKHPPKRADYTLDKELLKKSENFKKLLLKACTHYHPDKSDVKQYGLKWKVLCEEITKCLTNKYNLMKG